jgi:sulfhydrogenase subunit alpha
MKINLDYIARVEGEGSVNLEIKEGRLKDLKLKIWEPPRFFEGFLRGRRFDEVPDIVARICGICPVSHMTTSIRALERALDVSPSPEINRLRKLMSLSQIVSSHLIHLCILAMPDYFKLHSVADMLPKFWPEIKRMLRMKDVMNDITALFGGRALHPVAMVVGGFTGSISKDMIGMMVGELESIKGDAIEMLRVISELPFPDLSYESDFVAIHNPPDYAVNEGSIVTDKGINVKEDDYYTLFEEDEVSYSNAKRTVLKGGGSLMSGALARMNIKFDMLHEDAKRAARDIGFHLPDRNPFHNNIGQAIEIVHGISRCIDLLEELSAEKPEVQIKVRGGEGLAITEAPRGLLCHHYVLNRRGVVEKADIITPTAHNFMGMEENLRNLVQQHIHEKKQEISLKCEMLVRAYDPCFSCSVH